MFFFSSSALFHASFFADVLYPGDPPTPPAGRTHSSFPWSLDPTVFFHRLSPPPPPVKAVPSFLLPPFGCPSSPSLIDFTVPPRIFLFLPNLVWTTLLFHRESLTQKFSRAQRCLGFLSALFFFCSWRETRARLPPLAVKQFVREDFFFRPDAFCQAFCGPSPSGQDVFAPSVLVLFSGC